MTDNEKLPIADRIVELLDTLAYKLGVTSKEIWEFTLKAKRVEAFESIVLNGLLLLVMIAAWSWSFHVATMTLPHGTKTSKDFVTLQDTCDQYDVVQGKMLHQPCVKVVEKEVEVPGDISDFGGFLIVSGVVSFVAGLIFLIISISGIVGAIAQFYKLEYAAYNSIITGLVGKSPR